MSAATSLAVADPEEADANALFAAVKEYDKLRSQEVDCEVAAVCGLEETGFKADRKIRREVEAILSSQQYSGIVLISDGAEDELIIPILQNLKPIVSVRRVVVKHSQSVEENYMLLARYLRMLVFEPRYSKWTIGVPGNTLSPRRNLGTRGSGLPRHAIGSPHNRRGLPGARLQHRQVRGGDVEPKAIRLHPPFHDPHEHPDPHRGGLERILQHGRPGGHLGVDDGGQSHLRRQRVALPLLRVWGELSSGTTCRARSFSSGRLSACILRGPS